ncbi:hypothetical protein [Falsochrobactrum shanghaiense]|nr:hypothetical protein [Falsochrobactrum shanghaiense]
MIASKFPDAAKPQQPETGRMLDDFYSSGMYAGKYNPLGPIARSLSASTSAVGDALTFGWGDEISGLLGMDTQAIRNRQSALRESNPVASMVGSVGGALAAGGPIGKAGLSARAAGAGLGVRAAAGSAEGAALGSLYGAGAADDGSRGMGALTGGTIGGIAGGAFPLVASGVGKAYEAFRNSRNAAPIAKSAGITPEAARMLGSILDADGALGPQGQASMSRAGREAMLVDAGPTAQGVLDTTIQRGGPGSKIAREAIDARVGRDSAALSAALDDALGAPQGVTATREGIRTGSSSARQSAYNRAYSQPIDYAHPQAMQIEALVKGRVPSSAINRANQLMRAEGNQSQQILANISDDGAVLFERLPDVRQLDYITRALNDLAEAGEGAGAMGGQNALGRAYQNLSREIRDNLKSLVPEYGQALETAADPIRRSKAVELGSKLLSRGMARDEAAIAVRGMTGPEKHAVAQGIRSQIDEVMANVQRTATDPNVDARAALNTLKQLSSAANREKTSLVLGEQASRKLFDELDRVAQSFELRAGVTTNSRTYGRQAISKRVKDMAGADGPVRTVMRGEPVNATKGIMQILTGETPARQAAREDGLFAEIARLLTQQGGAGQGVYDAIGKIGQTDAATSIMRDGIIRALSGPQTSYPAGTLSQRIKE